jgi:hypothetical protein
MLFPQKKTRGFQPIPIFQGLLVEDQEERFVLTQGLSHGIGTGPLPGESMVRCQSPVGMGRTIL